jgi:hypothetical protein
MIPSSSLRKNKEVNKCKRNREKGRERDRASEVSLLNKYTPQNADREQIQQ